MVEQQLALGDDRLNHLLLATYEAPCIETLHHPLSPTGAQRGVDRHCDASSGWGWSDPITCLPAYSVTFHG